MRRCTVAAVFAAFLVSSSCAWASVGAWSPARTESFAIPRDEFPYTSFVQSPDGRLRYLGLYDDGASYALSRRRRDGSFAAPTKVIDGPWVQEPTVDVNNRGDLALGWARYGAGEPYDNPYQCWCVIQAKVRPAGSGFGPVQTLAPPDWDQVAPALAVGPYGDVTAAWLDGRDLRAAQSGDDHGFGARRTVGRDVNEFLLDATGSIPTLLWESNKLYEADAPFTRARAVGPSPAGLNSQDVVTVPDAHGGELRVDSDPLTGDITVQTRSAGRGFGPSRLVAHTRGGWCHVNAAMNHRNTAIVIWQCPAPANYVQAAFVSRAGEVVALSKQRPATSGFFLPGAAIDDRGRAITMTSGPRGAGFGSFIGGHRRFLAFRRIPIGDDWAGPPAVAITPNGVATAAWFVMVPGKPGRIKTARLQLPE